jgi:hypothetical protein
VLGSFLRGRRAPSSRRNGAKIEREAHLPMKRLITRIFKNRSVDVARLRKGYANPDSLEKASSYIERYREIVSDPLNILIYRVPEAGYVDKDGCVILHNGHRVPVQGSLAYYSEFSDILIIDRGVHEPLEEYCFQKMLTKINTESPSMIELGSYWAPYSMWLMKVFPKARCIMVEPKNNNLRCGKNNFAINGYRGEFLNEFVGDYGFRLDTFAKEREISSLDILHSDIQGHELELLQGGELFFSKKKAKYVFISTHSEAIHSTVTQKLRDYSYRLEVSSGYDTHTTSCDGFVLASSPDTDPIFGEFSPLGRVDIAKSTPEQLLRYANSTLNN